MYKYHRVSRSWQRSFAKPWAGIFTKFFTAPNSLLPNTHNRPRVQVRPDSQKGPQVVASVRLVKDSLGIKDSIRGPKPPPIFKVVDSEAYELSAVAKTHCLELSINSEGRKE